MKLILIFTLAVLSGCASVPSEYNQGCRDGVNGLKENKNEQVAVDNYCDRLDSAHRASERVREGGRR